MCNLKKRLFPLLCCVAQTAFGQISFQEMPGLAFLDSTAYLNGISWADVDNDNDLDVCVTGSGGNFPNFTNVSAIYLNQGGGLFANTGLLNSAQQNTMRHGWADADNDGDLDLYIAATWNSGGVNELWINQNGSAFTLETNSGATPNQPQPYEGTVSWADYDNDGWADLFLARWNDGKNKLYRNNGTPAPTFTEVTAGAVVNDLAWTSGGFWGDMDNDGDLDLYVVDYQTGATAPGQNDLFRNDGNGTFTKLTGLGLVVEAAQNARSANWVDVDNDGWLDLFVCNQFGQDLLHRNNGDGTFTTQPIGPANHTSWSSNWGDYDNDGDQDLVTIGFWGTDSRFWENDGQGNLSDATALFPQIFPTATNGSNSNGVVWVDYDRDGWLDLHVTQPDQSPDRFFRNLGAPCRSWLEIKCTGTASNRAAIGATVRAKASVGGQPVWQMRQVSAQTAATGSNPLWLHFGFADAALVDSLVVEWPSGARCVFTGAPVNQFVEIDEACGLQAIIPPAPLPGSTQMLALCLPAADTLLTPQAPPGGTWTADCGVCIDAGGVFHPDGLATGTYAVAYSQGGICGTSDSFFVTLEAAPALVVSADTTVYEGETVQLAAGGAADYNWFPDAALSCADCPDPVFTADTTTVFTVTGQTAAGCSAEANVTVTVLPKPDFQLPNAFSPDGDQVNEVFNAVFEGLVFQEYRLQVYDRWGELVFESVTPTEGWDGMQNGLPLPSDVYLFLLDYHFTDGRSGRERGEVMLLR